MADFYKMDPADWDNGTANLTLEEEAAYLRIVNSMHKHKAPVPDNDRVLAGMFRVSMRKARALLASLVAAGKVTVDGGYISNERAASDLVHRGFVSISRAETGAKGGRKRAENAAKALIDKDANQATASSREEKRREESIERGKPLSLITAGFQDFWDQYPHRNGAKKGRQAAEKSWVRQVKAGVSESDIISGAMRYATDRQVLQGYAKDPATWINQRGWEDDIEPHNATGTPQRRASGPHDNMVRAFSSVARSNDHH